MNCVDRYDFISDLCGGVFGEWESLGFFGYFKSWRMCYNSRDLWIRSGEMLVDGYGFNKRNSNFYL